MGNGELVRKLRDPTIDCSNKKVMFCLAVGCQLNVSAAVLSYCTYTRCVVLKAVDSVATWGAGLGFKETSSIPQHLIDFICQIIVGKLCESWAGLHKRKVKLKTRICFGLEMGLRTGSRDRGGNWSRGLSIHGVSSGGISVLMGQG